MTLVVIRHLVGAGLVTYGCNGNDSCQTRPYDCHHSTWLPHLLDGDWAKHSR
ncbi:MAG: hypothetical protein RID09_23215 [Coleofasciculus sp. G1-WW12-02]|uniref:hypothetical protein n=1 Tax=unclassified Coleofasciculus TaxID=2692782 RepID=UPI0033049ECA